MVKMDYHEVMSASPTIRFSKFIKGKTGKEKGGRMSDETASLGSASAISDGGIIPPSPGSDVSPGVRGRRLTDEGPSSAKRLAKDAKSRYNIGIVYLKTGDHVKAQENLEQALHCHMKMAGQDVKAYTSDEIHAIASVQDKLGDCYVADSAIADKSIALNHYEVARRLLCSVAPEDAPDNIKELLERVEEKLEVPELADNTRRPSTIMRMSRSLVKPQMQENDKDSVVQGRDAAVSALVANPQRTLMERHEGVRLSNISEQASDSDGFEELDIAMSHLERNNHRTALNQLMSMQRWGMMNSHNFQSKMVACLVKLADSAFEGLKVSVATDACEEAYAILKQDQGAIGVDQGVNAKENDNNFELAIKGCIKGHKLLAQEAEGKRDHGSAIEHRRRVHQLLNEVNRTIPACQQLLKIAYLHGEKDDCVKSVVALTDATQLLFNGVKSINVMPAARIDLLAQCYYMKAICYAKLKSWNEALEQYDKVLPLLLEKEGQAGQRYNCALIQKAALLVTLGNHRLAATTVNKYFQSSDLAGGTLGKIIVAEKDHVMALDTCVATHLKFGSTDEAVALFERKLAFVKTLCKNDAIKSDTQHKLGCLLAFKKQHSKALPLLIDAFNTRKFLYKENHRSVCESRWAVAAIRHALGDTEKALKEYLILLDNMNAFRDPPVNVIIILNAVGKLFFEQGMVDKAVSSFEQALQGSAKSLTTERRVKIMLNLANALTEKGDFDKASDLYCELLRMKTLKRMGMVYIVVFNKALLLIKMGDVDGAKESLHKIAKARPSKVQGVMGKVYLTLGKLAVAGGSIDQALEYYEKSLSEIEEHDVLAAAQTKRQIGLAYFATRQEDMALMKFEDVLEDLARLDGVGRVTDLQKAEIWNCMWRVYVNKDDIPQAKKFAKLALRIYMSHLGENHPLTLRNTSNLQLLLLEEAEGMDRKDAKPIIEAARAKMEETLNTFEALDDSWVYSADVVSLRINLGLIAVWQDKPKKARKLLRQIQDIELPPKDPLIGRVAIFEKQLGHIKMKNVKFLGAKAFEGN